MDMKTKDRKRKAGFTLAELLIVVAIIAVLVAIAIPVFNNQLEKSRDATTVANIRTAYAEASAAYMTDDGTTKGNVTVDSANDKVTVANVSFKSQKKGLGSDLDSLTWLGNKGAFDAAATDPGVYQLVFTFSSTDNSVTVAATKTGAANSGSNTNNTNNGTDTTTPPATSGGTN